MSLCERAFQEITSQYNSLQVSRVFTLKWCFEYSSTLMCCDQILKDLTGAPTA